MTDDEAGLVFKYERMLALRRTLPRGAPSLEDRERLRSLARDFPGALRELETLTTEEIDARLRTCRQAAAGAASPDWLRWMAAYHALMRRALALRNGAIDPDEAFSAAVRSPRHGRMNVVVFEALARHFALPVATLWDALFPRRAGGVERAHRFTDPC